MMTSADLQACRDAVSRVVAALDQLDQGLQQPTADTLPMVAKELGRCLEETRRLFDRHFPPGALPPADLVEAVSTTNARLAATQDALHRRRASVQRGLESLFPSEQANAYSSLGKNLGDARPRISNLTSVKA